MEIDLDTVEFTRMSTRGQVVIPERIRKQFDLRHGTVFIVEECCSAEQKGILLTPFNPKIHEVEKKKGSKK